MLRKDKINSMYTVSEGSIDPSDAVVIPVDFRVTSDTFIQGVAEVFGDTRTSTDVTTNNEDIEGQSDGIE